MYREVIFDIETKKLFDQLDDPTDLPALGVSIVSAYSRVLDENLDETEGRLVSFWEADLGQLWPLFESADRIIGFNSLKFDAPVIAPLYPGADLLKLPHFDMLAVIKDSLGHRIGLDALARETLGEAKLASGLDAVDWWNSGTKEALEKLKKYCEQDVVVTTRLYDHALKQGRLKFKNKWNELKEFEVDFSYPPPPAEAQMGLF
jgi:DEAD/DEAH box helicase domain-containing protein